ncbi:MAG: WYL domain-containing protein, partial [Nocardioides sp.]
MARLLALVPYLYAHGDGVSLERAAADLRVAPDQLVSDLKVLFMCGLPGGYPDDLIDVDLDALEGEGAEGVIRVSNADYLSRPLRLTPTEASALIVALRALRGSLDSAGPSWAEKPAGRAQPSVDVVDRALRKLELAAAAGEVAVDPGVAPPELATLRASLEGAIHAGLQVQLTYWVPSRD